jgi:hypothetical protein
MLVKLTEIAISGPVTNTHKWLLKEVFVNPEHVVMIREQPRVYMERAGSILSESVSDNERFSKLLINRGSGGTEIVVVGSPDVVESALNRNSKQLLKG